MTGTLFVRADGTSGGASMVKTSVDLASEAPRCQRISSMTAQITFGWATMVECHDRILFDGAPCGKTMRAATGRPRYPIRNTQMGEVDPPIPVHRPVPESVLLSPGR